MRAYSFSGNDYTYTSSYTVEITDRDEPYWNTEGNPKEIPVPSAFEKYGSVVELGVAIEETGKVVGKIGCSELVKFKGKFVAMDQYGLWMVSFKKKGSRKAFFHEFGYELEKAMKK